MRAGCRSIGMRRALVLASTLRPGHLRWRRRDCSAGRPATTRWFFAGDFGAAFPPMRMEADRMVVDDGDIVTAGGLARRGPISGLPDRRAACWGRDMVIDRRQPRFPLLIDPSGREQKHYASFAPNS